LFSLKLYYRLAEPNIDKLVLVSEDLIEKSIVTLFEVDKSVIEGAGAVGLSAIMSGKLPELLGKK
jgi:threonine dehydratase